MIARKNLGMGLDILLNASNNRNLSNTGEADLKKARSMFEQAIHEEENGNVFEAYYQYRKVIDYLEDYSSAEKNGASTVLSESFNNMAIILCENRQADAALSCLRKAISICPENQVARENLEILLQEE